MASELEGDLVNTANCRRWFVDFNADWSNNTDVIDVKMDGFAFEEKLSFKMLRLSFSFNLDWGYYIVSVAKTVSKKTGALIRSMKFLSPEVALYLHKSTILLPCLGWCSLLLFGYVR